MAFSLHAGQGPFFFSSGKTAFVLWLDARQGLGYNICVITPLPLSQSGL